MVIIKADNLGEIPNIGNLYKIKPKYLPMIKDAREVYQKILGKNLICIYVRGSVSTGKDTKFSDLDLVAVTSKKVNNKQEKELLNFTEKLQGKYKFINGFELAVVPLNQLIKSKDYFNLRINLKTSSVFLFGKDIRSKLPKVILNKKLSMQMFRYASEEYQIADKYFSSTTKRSYLGKVRPEEFWCGWVMRVLSRSGMGILMLKEKKYTNDIIYITQRMAKEYPEFKGFFEQMAKWVINPIPDRKKVKLFLDENVESYFKFWKKLLV